MHETKYQDLAIKYGKTPLEMKKICNSQFEYVRKVIQEGNDDQIMLQFLGKFLVKPYRRASLKRKRCKKGKLQ